MQISSVLTSSRTLLVVLCALGSVWAGLQSMGCDRQPEEELWVIGLDGADWDVLDPMIAKGELPNIASLRSGGAWGRLRSDEPMLSPILWTSIATGKTADLHGVTWFMSDAPDGSKIPVSSRNRWVRAIWNIASEAGKGVGVVGWWATWPAEPVDGFIVSDYVGWHSFGVTGRTLEAPGKTYPASLHSEVVGHFPDPASIEDALLQRMVHLPSDRLGFDAAAGPFGGPISHLRQAIATTIGYTQLTIEQLQEKRPEFLAVYYEGTDAVEHLFGGMAAPRLPWIEDADFAAYRDVVNEYWKWQDEQLGLLLAERGPQTTVVLVSDHGFRTGDERLKEDEFRIELADASHMTDGIIVMNGPAQRSGRQIQGATIYDVTPTLLHLLGLPTADDFEGRVLVDGFDPEWLLTHPVERIATYEVGEWDRGDTEIVDDGSGEQMQEMLASLGYISGGSDDSGGGSAPGNAEQAVNLAIVLRQRGKFVEAAETLQEVLQEQPTHIEARSNLARVHAEMDELEAAEELYRGLVADQPEALSHHEDLALCLALQEKMEEAVAAYRAGLEQDPKWAMGLAGAGFAQHRLGDSEAGLSDVDAALALDPRLADAHYFRGSILLDQGRDPEGLGELRRALELSPGHPGASLRMAAAAAKAGTGDPNEIIASLTSALELNPADDRIRAELGAVYLMVNRVDEALPLLIRASDTIVDDPTLQGNTGMALARSGDFAGAAERFERVLELDPSSSEAIATLGQLRMQLGQPERAEELLRRAIEVNPESAGFHYSLGEFLHRTAQLDEAQEQYEEAIRLDETVGVFQYQLGMVLGQKGDEAGALEWIRRARLLDPSLPALPNQ